jgi:hypothetical protein
MKRSRIARSIALAATAALAVPLGVAGCGASKSPTKPSHSGVGGRGDAGDGAGEAGGTAGSGIGGRAAGSGGKQGVAGGGMAGGIAGAGPSASGNGGTSGMLGSPGGESNGGESSCEPEGPGAPCFEPCGGEPFGSWVLEDACASGSFDNGTCRETLTGTPGDTRLRVLILTDGLFKVYGEEDWALSAMISPACFPVSSVESCPFAMVSWSAFLFAYASASFCTPGECDQCACETKVSGKTDATIGWTTAGTRISYGSGSLSAEYCVQGDTLWMGGTSSDGRPKVSYKFKRQSCAGRPVPCGERAAAECAQGDGCLTGSCKPVSGSEPTCDPQFGEQECSELEECTWDPDGCRGQAPETCTFETCDEAPGCTWGAPRERCAGYAWECNNRYWPECEGYGCTLDGCKAGTSDIIDCATLAAFDCERTEGCVVEDDGTCSGQSRCSLLTDGYVCERIGCRVGNGCIGETVQCTELTPSMCTDVPGCRIEY